jgi:hypothetical protein
MFFLKQYFFLSKYVYIRGLTSDRVPRTSVLDLISNLWAATQFALVKNVWQQRRKKWARENMLFGTCFLYFWRMGKRLQTFSICKVQGSRPLRLFFVI